MFHGPSTLKGLYNEPTYLKQYVDQTAKEFRYRWNNYKNNSRNYQEYGTCIQQHTFEHFYGEWHHSFLEDVSITLIDKTDPSNPLQRENYWRSTLKTMTPCGLNVEDCVWNNVLPCSYHWICTDCNKDLIYGKRFCYRLLLLLFSLPFLLLYCFYYDDYCDFISILIIIIINIGITITTIIINFMMLLLLLLHHFLSLLTLTIYHHYFQYYHYYYYCITIIIIFLLFLTIAIIIKYHFLLLLSSLLHKH